MFWFQLGSFGCNFVVTELVAVLGAKRTVFLSMSVYAAAMTALLRARSLFVVSVAGLLFGFNDQVIVLTTTIVMNALFPPAEATARIALCYVGFAAGPLLWPLVMGWMVNPHNAPPTVFYLEGGEPVGYFDASITANVRGFLLLQLAAHLAAVGLLAALFRAPAELRGGAGEVLSHVLGGRGRDAAAVVRQSVMRLEGNYRRSIAQSLKRTTRAFLGRATEAKSKPLLSFSSEANRRHAAPRLTAPSTAETPLAGEDSRARLTHSGEEPPFSAWETARSRDFGLIVLLALLRLASNRFFSVYFKLIGLQHFRSDRLVNVVVSLANTGYIAEGLAFGFILQRLGLRRCYELFFASTAAAYLLYFFAMDSVSAYALLAVHSRFMNGFNVMLSLTTVFGKYGKERGLLLFRYFDLSAMASIAVINQLGAVFGARFGLAMLGCAGMAAAGLALLPLVELGKDRRLRPQIVDEAQFSADQTSLARRF